MASLVEKVGKVERWQVISWLIQIWQKHTRVMTLTHTNQVTCVNFATYSLSVSLDDTTVRCWI